ncbi:MAG: arginase [Crocinitomicaceae bacterium]
MAEIKIIENSSELGAGTRGSSLGIGALKVVAHNKESDFFGRYERFEVDHENEQLNETTPYENAKHIDGITTVYRNTMDVVAHVMSEGDFPVVLSGDHACAGGTIAGIKKQFPDRKLGVIWIDAHADLHTPYTTPSGNVHGMPLATALGSDNLDSQINVPHQDVVDYWNEMKNLGGVCPKLDPKNLVFIGVRDTEIPERSYMDKHGIKNYSVDELRERGLQEVIKEVKEKLSDCSMVYISFDVDSMDCILVSKGTGTPVENGLSPNEAKELMNTFAQWEKVNCIEMVEINPCLDDKINKMAETAYDILENFIPHIENRL